MARIGGIGGLAQSLTLRTTSMRRMQSYGIWRWTLFRTSRLSARGFTRARCIANTIRCSVTSATFARSTRARCDRRRAPRRFRPNLTSTRSKKRRRRRRSITTRSAVCTPDSQATRTATSTRRLFTSSTRRCSSLASSRRRVLSIVVSPSAPSQSKCSRKTRRR